LYRGFNIGKELNYIWGGGVAEIEKRMGRFPCVGFEGEFGGCVGVRFGIYDVKE
jgi:hypothetical protein